MNQFEKKIKKTIKQLSNLNSAQRYQLQCLMLDHITKKICELSNKIELFWKYVKDDKNSWKSHYANERALKKAFSALSDVINSIRKTKNIYDETLKRIEALWKSAKENFARDQSMQMLRSMRRCVLRSMSMKNARHVVNLTVKNRLKNLDRKVSINRKSINRDWIKMTTEEYVSREIESTAHQNSQLTTLSSSLSFVVVMSLCLALRLKKKKENRKTIFIVFFSSNVFLLIRKKKNRKSNFIVFFLDRISSSSSLTSSFVVSKSSLSTRLSSSFSSFMFKNIVMIFETLMRNIISFFESHFEENLLIELIHSEISSFVLSSRSFFFVTSFFASFSFVSFVFLLSSDATRFHKRVRESSSSTHKKRIRSTDDHCDCMLSMKWFQELKKACCIENIKNVEHLLSELYYLKRQICKKHINQLRQLYELLSIENSSEMKEMLWKLLKFEEEVEIFKIERANLFETSKEDD